MASFTQRTMIGFVLPDIATEDRLLSLAREGDPGAVTAIYERYFEPVYQFIRLRVDDAQVAEDLSSEVFVRLIGSLGDRHAPRHSLRAWLFRVARNMLHDHYGKRQRLAMTALNDWLPAPPGDEPEAQVLAGLEAERIRQALRRLPVDQQEVLILRFGQMLSLQETAAILGKRVGAVKSLQFRATSKLRQLMTEMG